MAEPTEQQFLEGKANGTGQTNGYIRHVAEREIREERLREAVEIEKQRIRNRKPFWSFLPFTITINWKK